MTGPAHPIFSRCLADDILKYAIDQAHAELLNVLCSLMRKSLKSARLLVQGTPTTPLHYVVNNFQEQRMALAQALLDGGVDVNASPSGGNTALHLAVQSSDAVLVELLLDNGADSNLTDAYVVCCGNYQLGWALLRKGWLGTMHAPTPPGPDFAPPPPNDPPLASVGVLPKYATVSPS